jgi:hypothetical protein
MALWKHYIVLFGGFYDPGITSKCQCHQACASFRGERCLARYMNDLWVFDMLEYKWQQIEYKDPNERRPS